MSIDRTKIEQIARLARLSLDADNAAAYAADLSNILALFEQMDRVDTREVAPLAHPLELPARLRGDEITESDQRDKFQALAPTTAAGCYLVPRVIE